MFILENSLKIHKVNVSLNYVQKNEQNKPILSKRKMTISIKTEISEIENKYLLKKIKMVSSLITFKP